MSTDTLTIDRRWVRDHATAWAANHYGSYVLANSFGTDFSWDVVADPSLANMDYVHYARSWERTSDAFDIWTTLGRPRTA